MSKKKMGRPPVPEKEFRKPGFSARLTEQEAREVTKAIEKSGMKKSEWIREALLEKARLAR